MEGLDRLPRGTQGRLRVFSGFLSACYYFTYHLSYSFFLPLSYPSFCSLLPSLSYFSYCLLTRTSVFSYRFLLGSLTCAYCIVLLYYGLTCSLQVIIFIHGHGRIRTLGFSTIRFITERSKQLGYGSVPRYGNRILKTHSLSAFQGLGTESRRAWKLSAVSVASRHKRRYR